MLQVQQGRCSPRPVHGTTHSLCIDRIFRCLCSHASSLPMLRFTSMCIAQTLNILTPSIQLDPL